MIKIYNLIDIILEGKCHAPPPILYDRLSQPRQDGHFGPRGPLLGGRPVHCRKLSTLASAPHMLVASPPLGQLTAFQDIAKCCLDDKIVPGGELPSHTKYHGSISCMQVFFPLLLSLLKKKTTNQPSFLILIGHWARTGGMTVRYVPYP